MELRNCYLKEEKLQTLYFLPKFNRILHCICTCCTWHYAYGAEHGVLADKQSWILLWKSNFPAWAFLHRFALTKCIANVLSGMESNRSRRVAYHNHPCQAKGDPTPPCFAFSGTPRSLNSVTQRCAEWGWWSRTTTSLSMGKCIATLPTYTWEGSPYTQVRV